MIKNPLFHNEKINLDDHQHINQISLPETTSFEKITKYSKYIILIILFTLAIKFIINIIQESEEETKRENTKHSTKKGVL
jgi:hypothetical protein